MNKLTESVRDEASKIIATKRSAWVISSAILAILILLILPDVALGLVPAITISKTPPTQTVVSGARRRPPRRLSAAGRPPSPSGWTTPVMRR
jgi:hypothetical protein